MGVLTLCGPGMGRTCYLPLPRHTAGELADVVPDVVLVQSHTGAWERRGNFSPKGGPWRLVKGPHEVGAILMYASVSDGG